MRVARRRGGQRGPYLDARLDKVHEEHMPLVQRPPDHGAGSTGAREKNTVMGREQRGLNIVPRSVCAMVPAVAGIICAASELLARRLGYHGEM